MPRIQFSPAFGTGERYRVDLPDPAEIPVPAVAKAVVELREEHARFKEQRRLRDATSTDADKARTRAVNIAAEQGKKKKDLPKDIRQSIKAAKAEAEEAQLQLEARAEVFRHSYMRLVAELEANRAPLVEASLKKAGEALQRMAAAREAFTSAAADAEVSYGLLGMFAAARTAGVRPILVELPKSKRKNAVSASLSAMGDAVGFSNLDLTAFQRGTAPTKRELEATDGEE